MCVCVRARVCVCVCVCVCVTLLGNIGPQSSQLAEPLWTDPGINSGISLRELISINKYQKKKKKKKRKKSAGGE